MFATYTLHDILPQRDFQCFQKFVIDCTFICNRVLTNNDIILADNLLMQLCNSFENLYGNESITPNMHLHGHLKECMLDYGPVYSFWLFSFERYNGLLGSLPTNRRNIELQFMKRFVRDSIIITKDFSDVNENIFTPLINSMTKGSDRGTLNDIRKSDILPFMKLSSRLTDFTKVPWCVSDEIRSSGTKTKYILDEIEMHCLTRFYQIVYPNVDPSKMFVPRTSKKIPIIYSCGELFG